ncbi:MAG: hydroxymethylglutaryl-CoA reductase [Bacteroidota bacterium]
MKSRLVNGFSKLGKEEKLDKLVNLFEDAKAAKNEFKSYWHDDAKKQQLFDEFSENTLSNFYLPFSIAPNFVINHKIYHVPMVIEESSVIAAASKAAKFWSDKGGFRANVISTVKVGQVHFSWQGDIKKLHKEMPVLKEIFLRSTNDITKNMRSRGGGISDIEFVDKSLEMEHYFQIHVKFETVDSMGANFINSCLEEIAAQLKLYISNKSEWSAAEQKCTIIMSILSNYTPECIVETHVETKIENFAGIDPSLSAKEFVYKFEKAVNITKIDVYRATTHNKGIFNGIDAVTLATGNDFRAVEACGHAYAAKNGSYKGLTDVSVANGKFRYSLKIPLSIGTVGGLTTLHPLAKRSLEMLGNPNAEELMQIAASAGLANNFSAVKSLITMGIQVGHMKMHLWNILNQFEANDQEKQMAVEHYQNHKVSFDNVRQFLSSLRIRSAT